jgi:hypothetical protein
MPALAHIGIGLVTKKLAPRIPLWVLLISAMILDLLSFVFLFAIWITHGLFMAIIWSIIAMLITVFIVVRLNSKNEHKNVVINISLTIGLLVFSHWILDFIGWPMSVIDPSATGVPLLFDDVVNLGLGVYSTWFGALIMDIGVFIVGLAIYIHYLKKVKNQK